jgi:deoxyxylulose-5-phosphate synthase
MANVSEAMENALEQAKNFGAPVLVHVITEKGRGHAPALNVPEQLTRLSDFIDTAQAAR